MNPFRLLSPRAAPAPTPPPKPAAKSTPASTAPSGGSDAGPSCDELFEAKLAEWQEVLEADPAKD